MKHIIKKIIDILRRRNFRLRGAVTLKDAASYIHEPPDSSFLRDFSPLASKICLEKRTYLKKDRLYILWQALNSVRDLKGDCIEIGTFRGGSAKFIGAANRILCEKVGKLFVLDTFEGHPECIDDDNDRVDIHYIGKFNNTSYSEVLQYLEEYEEIQIYKGDCINLLSELKLDRIRFAHIDVDLFRPILHCLKILDNHLVQSGVIVVDDYSAPTCPGVEKAINEFLADHSNYSLWFFRTEQAVLIKR